MAGGLMRAILIPTTDYMYLVGKKKYHLHSANSSGRLAACPISMTHLVVGLQVGGFARVIVMS
jgi:hypothetical protein